MAGAAVLTILSLVTSNTARADDDNQDYNSYWQEQNETQQQEQTELSNLQQDYNAYWQEAQEQQPSP